MTAPVLFASYNAQMKSHYYRLRGRFAKRDSIAGTIHQVRQGNITQLFPDELEFSLDFNGSPVANFVDIVARDMAEGIAPLPALACVSGRMQSDADLERAEIKNRIGDNFWRHSRLEIQMMKAADWYVSYGFVPFFVEPDHYNKLPYIHAENPRDSWYELDRYGKVRIYAHRWMKSVDQLAVEFPEFASAIRLSQNGMSNEQGDRELELVRWVEGSRVTFFLPEREGMELLHYDHLLECPPVVIAERPGEDDSPRGQFDDVVWVQVARSIMSTLALEAAYEAVQAPIGLPEDVDKLNIGPKAIIQSKDIDKAHRLDLSLPASIFGEEQVLDNELRVGARYPEARSGQPGTSVITGKGVEALLGTFDSQIKGAQLIFKTALQEITALAFELDEKWYGSASKQVEGTISGRSFVFEYVPAKAINGHYGCSVTYGFAAGLAPAQSIITMLQLEGAGLIAKGTTMENLPFSIDQVQEMRKIDIESSREALKQGVFALVQSSGQLAAAGQDPMPIINLAVSVIKALQDGQPVEDAVAAAYQVMQQAQQAAQQQAQQQAQDALAAQGGGAPGGDQPDQSGMGSDGRPTGVAEGQAGLPPGGRPPLEQMISGFRGNGSLPVMQNEIRRSVPIGTA